MERVLILPLVGTTDTYHYSCCNMNHLMVEQVMVLVYNQVYLSSDHLLLFDQELEDYVVDEEVFEYELKNFNKNYFEFLKLKTFHSTKL